MNELLATPVRSVIECIESWHDENGNFYRVYSDGYIEQGGISQKFIYGSGTVVTLNKPFTSANYIVIAANTGADLGDSCERGYAADIAIKIINNSSFKMMTGGTNDVPRYWYACGY